ncbi:hypothetical protein ANCCEY_13284 [Ancylostoma ceylanicum]|uniref:DUF7596 domain-containing protein n=1 Tax=Ancylostoma ceylanicum TaxID=53326 RepID=A0A0D6L957_9BILA|nr:hypothetical protein ANCCEY_13284 [Ancylostoma ceylanicum]
MSIGDLRRCVVCADAFVPPRASLIQLWTNVTGTTPTRDACDVDEANRVTRTEKENRRLLPLYVQFHTVPEARPAEAHLVDRLAEHALGRFNLELKKNVTHDSFVESDSWRDEAGFIVTDRNRFVYVTFKTSALLPTLTPAGLTERIMRLNADVILYNRDHFSNDAPTYNT